MDFKYYLIDLYDFTIYDELDDLIALGIARCYEIYGYTYGSTFWKRTDNKVHYFLFEEVNNLWNISQNAGMIEK